MIYMKMLAFHLLMMMKLVNTIAKYVISTLKVILSLKCMYPGALRRAKTRKCYRRAFQ